MRFTPVLTSALAFCGGVIAMPNPVATALPARGQASYPASKQSGNSVALAEFDIVWWFLSFGIPSISYTAYGQWATCYNIPGLFGTLTGSIKPENGSPGCWIYREDNCVGTFTVVEPKGDDIWDGESGSFICDAPKK